MKIQSSLFQVHNRKKLTWKLILCVFEHCVLLNFKASAAETGIYHSLEIVFLESTVHRLSVDTLLFYSCINKTVHEDTKQVISSASSKRLTWKLILRGFEPCVLLNFKASAAETWIYHGLEIVFLNLRSIGFLSIPYSCIKRQSMKIQSSLFQVHNRKRLAWKLILRGFEPCVLLNFKASAAETGIFHALKIVFLESTVHRLSVVDLSSCLKRQSMKIQSSLFQVHNRKRLWKLILCGFEPCVLLNFKASAAETWILCTVWKNYFWNIRSIGFLSMLQYVHH